MSFYPFVLQLCDGTTDSNVQSHRYNGKELDKMHGLNTYDYGARQYNPVTARWDRMDPLAEKYYSISPYAYCAGNPVRYVDPDGRIVFLAPIVYAMCTGAAIGASVEYGSQVVENYFAGDGWQSFTNVDIGDIGIEGLYGAVTFGSSSTVRKTSKVVANLSKDLIENTFDVNVENGCLDFNVNSAGNVLTSTLIDGFTNSIAGNGSHNKFKPFKNESSNQVSNRKREKAHAKGNQYSSKDAKKNVNAVRERNELKKRMNKDINEIVSAEPSEIFNSILKAIERIIEQKAEVKSDGK